MPELVVSVFQYWTCTLVNDRPIKRTHEYVTAVSTTTRTTLDKMSSEITLH